ncbi:hypothetical protein Dimus_006837 [Dionaea muscipula]
MPIASPCFALILCVLLHFSSVFGARPLLRVLGNRKNKPQDGGLIHISNFKNDVEVQKKDADQMGGEKAHQMASLKGNAIAIISNELVKNDTVLHKDHIGDQYWGHDDHHHNQEHKSCCRLLAAAAAVDNNGDKGTPAAAAAAGGGGSGIILSMMKKRKRRRRILEAAVTASWHVPPRSTRGSLPQPQPQPGFNLDYAPPKVHPGVHN